MEGDGIQGFKIKNTKQTTSYQTLWTASKHWTQVRYKDESAALLAWIITKAKHTIHNKLVFPLWCRLHYF